MHAIYKIKTFFVLFAEPCVQQTPSFEDTVVLKTLVLYNQLFTYNVIKRHKC